MNHIVPANTKFTFTTRRINKSDICSIEKDISTAVSGDLVLAKVASISSHKRVQLASGRTSELHIDDYVVLCCGARYAPDQFEGIAELNNEICDMLAGGGVIGKMREKHEAIKNPTQLKPIGLLCDRNGQTINIERYALPTRPFINEVPVIAVTGAAMNSGKTTAAYSLVNGLSKSGLSVCAIKITGTGAFGDFNAFSDAGAISVSDFTDAGMATTYKQPINRIVNGAETLLADAVSKGADVIVVELGDGVLQEEASRVLCHPNVKNWLSGILFASPDALSAIAGVDFLKRNALPVMAVSGLLSRSPLLCKEFTNTTSLPVLSKSALSDSQTALGLVTDKLQLVAAA